MGGVPAKRDRLRLSYQSQSWSPTGRRRARMSGSGEQGVVGRAIGDGRKLFSAGQVHGVARRFLAPADVVLARENELAGVIAFVERGGMTFLSPVISQVGAVVCTNGSLEAPLAILARELE